MINGSVRAGGFIVIHPALFRRRGTRTPHFVRPRHGGYPCIVLWHPLTPPAPAAGGYPYVLSGLHRWVPVRRSGNPHLTRAFGAPPPPPPGGGGSAWRYQGSSRIRGGAGGKPCSGPWGYRHGGRGRRGGGLPPLLSLTPKLHNSRCRHPARAARSSPAPPGAWAVMAISSGKPWMGMALVAVSQVEQGRAGISPMGEAARGGRARPLPCLHLGLPAPRLNPCRLSSGRRGGTGTGCTGRREIQPLLGARSFTAGPWITRPLAS